ncbi:MAG: 2-oxoacid:ferredoxin oxidoreductase subunit gamma, partial [Firmicutes bacterium]|nr:2-oxoacid:ferredoxin oxidoreductase subunit gamma [Bacillota bacterium]
LVINSSLVTREPKRKDVTVVKVAATDIANEMGNVRVANMVALGAVIGSTGVVTAESLLEALRKNLPAHRQNLLPLNKEAIEKGRDAVKK